MTRSQTDRGSYRLESASKSTTEACLTRQFSQRSNTDSQRVGDFVYTTKSNHWSLTSTDQTQTAAFTAHTACTVFTCLAV